jgi:hypothetical protein
MTTDTADAHWLEWRKIMSKTNDTPNFSHGTKDHGTLADSELDAVTGGYEALSKGTHLSEVTIDQ